MHTFQYIVESLGLDEGALFNLYREGPSITDKAAWALKHTKHLDDPDFKTGTMADDQAFLRDLIAFYVVFEGMWMLTTRFRGCRKPWISRKKKFFETRVIEYQNGGAELGVRTRHCKRRYDRRRTANEAHGRRLLRHSAEALRIRALSFTQARAGHRSLRLHNLPIGAAFRPHRGETLQTTDTSRRVRS